MPKNMENLNCVSNWFNNDIFTIRIKGDGEFVKKQVATLEKDFNEPKFGYNGELYDEYQK